MGRLVVPGHAPRARCGLECNSESWDSAGLHKRVEQYTRLSSNCPLRFELRRFSWLVWHEEASASRTSGVHRTVPVQAMRHEYSHFECACSSRWSSPIQYPTMNVSPSLPVPLSVAIGWHLACAGSREADRTKNGVMTRSGLISVVPLSGPRRRSGDCAAWVVL